MLLLINYQLLLIIIISLIGVCFCLLRLFPTIVPFLLLSSVHRTIGAH